MKRVPGVSPYAAADTSQIWSEAILASHNRWERGIDSACNAIGAPNRLDEFAASIGKKKFIKVFLAMI